MKAIMNITNYFSRVKFTDEKKLEDRAKKDKDVFISKNR